MFGTADRNVASRARAGDRGGDVGLRCSRFLRAARLPSAGTRRSSRPSSVVFRLGQLNRVCGRPSPPTTWRPASSSLAWRSLRCAGSAGRASWPSPGTRPPSTLFVASVLVYEFRGAARVGARPDLRDAGRLAPRAAAVARWTCSCVGAALAWAAAKHREVPPADPRPGRMGAARQSSGLAGLTARTAIAARARRRARSSCRPPCWRRAPARRCSSWRRIAARRPRRARRCSAGWRSAPARRSPRSPGRS